MTLPMGPELTGLATQEDTDDDLPLTQRIIGALISTSSRKVFSPSYFALK